MPIYSTPDPKRLIPRSGVYLIRCTVNGKVYVGESIAIRSRWAGHRKALDKGTAAPAFVRDWRRYGSANFEWAVLEAMPYLPPMHHEDWVRTLVAAEKKWIAHYQSNNPRHGYNRIQYLMERECEWRATARWQYKPKS